MHKELSNIPIFAHCCMHHPRYAQKLQYKSYPRNTILHTPSDPIEAFGLVVSGTLKAERYTAQGDALCCAYFEDNDVFPELLYFTGKKQYSYTLVSIRKTCIAWMKVEDVEEMLQEDPKMMHAFLLYLSKRGMKNQMLLSCLEYRTIRQRIAYWLINMNHLVQDDKIPLPHSQSIFANMLHVSRSSLNQELKMMEKDGLIKVMEHELIVCNQNELEQYL